MLSSFQAFGRGLSAMAASAAQQARLTSQFQQEATPADAAPTRSSSSGDDEPRVTVGEGPRASAAALQPRVVDEPASDEYTAKLTEAVAESSALVATADGDAAATAPTTEAGSATAPRMIPFPELQPSEARVAMSACLLGHEVRYNKGHCHARAVVNLLGSAFKFVPVCPELDIGLGVPRPTLRLVGDGRMLERGMDLEDLAGAVRLFCPDTEEDLTERMLGYASAKVRDLRGYGCDGFILKRDSPSCGLDRVKLYRDRSPTAQGRSMYTGLFARTLVQEWPELPVTEEGRLTDEDTRDNFVRQVICHHHWRQLDGSFGSVVKYHETHKYVLLAQDPATLKELGRFLAKGKAHFAENDGAAHYYRRFFAAMKVLVGRGRHVNVLQHMCGFVRPHADPALYASLKDAIDDFRDGNVPLVVPLTLLQVVARSIIGEAAAGDASEMAATAGNMLLASEYVKGAPRSLKAHTAISQRTESKVPEALAKASAGAPKA